MRLKSVEIQNYRSILRTTRLDLDCNLSVLIGPNNEGKSNVLMAVKLCFDCLASAGPTVSSIYSDEDAAEFRTPSSFDWHRDFPIAAQQPGLDQASRILIEFELTPVEQIQYKNIVGSTTNSSLPLEFLVGPKTFTMNVRKRRVAALTRKRAAAISRFVRQRFDFLYIPAIRPPDISMGVIADLIERELAALSENAEYVDALKTVADIQRPVYERLAREVQASLRVLLPSVRSVKINLPESERTRRPRFLAPSFKVDDGTATELEAKGDGIKSLIAIALMRASGTGRAQGDLAVAIEEPESHLHPDAVHQLGKVLQEMAEEHQVLITTHSPLLAVREKIKANIIVAQSTARPAANIVDIRDCLGVRVQDNLSTAACVIMVEGDCDEVALDSLFKALSPDFRAMRECGKIGWDPLDGATNVGYKAALYRQSIISPYLIVDDDPAGQAAITEGTTSGRLAVTNCFKLTCPGKHVSELEDHYDSGMYWECFGATLGGCPDLAAFNAIRSKWSDRARFVSNRAGKQWDERVEKMVKVELAKWFAEDPLSKVLPTSKALFQGIVDTITSSVARL